MKQQRWMSQNFFVFFFTWGIFLPYWTGWLVSEKGLDVAEAGVIMGSGLIIRGLSTMSFYPLISKYFNLKIVLTLLSFTSLLLILLYLPVSSYTALFAVTVLFSAVYPCLLPAVENAAGTLVQKGKVHYGRSRSFGSLGYVIAVFVVSAFTGPFGDGVILNIMIVGLAILLLLQFLPAPTALSVRVDKEQKDDDNAEKLLFKEKSFLIVLLIAIFLQGAHASYYNYGYIYLQDLGLKGFAIGILLNIAVIFEIFYFARADHVLTRWKPSSLMLLASFGSTVRWILYWFPNLWTFILSQTLHSLSFAMAHFAFIRFITENLSPRQNAIAQGLYSALAMSFSTAFLTLAGGYLYKWDPRLAFLGMLICTLPAIAIILGTRKRYNY